MSATPTEAVFTRIQALSPWDLATRRSSRAVSGGLPSSKLHAHRQSCPNHIGSRPVSPQVTDPGQSAAMGQQPPSWGPNGGEHAVEAQGRGAQRFGLYSEDGMVKPHNGRQQRRRSTYAPLAVCLVVVVAALTALGLCHHHQNLQWTAPVVVAPTWSESTAPSDRDLLSSAALASAATAAAASPHHPDVTTSHVGNDQTEHAAAESSSESVAVGVPGVIRRQTANVTTTSATAAATVLEVFQVHQPVLTPSGPTLDDDAAASDDDEASGGSAGDTCSVVLMDHVFAFSYGDPFIGAYTPPDCDFNRVVINFTVVSEGRQ